MIKGKIFPSFTEPSRLRRTIPDPVTRVLPINQSWIAHSGRSARMRYLRQLCKEILTSKDRETIFAVNKIQEILNDELLRLATIYKSLEIAKATEISFSDTVEILLGKMKEEVSKETEVTNVF